MGGDPPPAAPAPARGVHDPGLGATPRQRRGAAPGRRLTPKARRDQRSALGLRGQDPRDPEWWAQGPGERHGLPVPTGLRLLLAHRVRRRRRGARAAPRRRRDPDAQPSTWRSAGTRARTGSSATPATARCGSARAEGWTRPSGAGASPPRPPTSSAKDLVAVDPSDVLVLRGTDDRVDGLVPPGDEDGTELATELSELRLVKDELRAREAAGGRRPRRQAGSRTSCGRCRPPSAARARVEGVFNLRARVEGNDVGYGTIAAAGAHACDPALDPQRRPACATATCCCSTPASRATTSTPPTSRARCRSRHVLDRSSASIYELVYAAQKRRSRRSSPGNDFLRPRHRGDEGARPGARATSGSCTIGAEEALRTEHQFYKRYSLHNVSHMLGLDVHDCAAGPAGGLQVRASSSRAWC